MGTHPLIGDVTINLPNLLELSVSVAEEIFDMEASDVRSHGRWLDMATGVLTRSAEWHTRSGSVLQLTWKRFASWADKHLFLQQLEVVALVGEAQLVWKAGIDADITTNGHRHFTTVETEATPSHAHVEVQTDGGDTVVMDTAVVGHNGEDFEGIALPTTAFLEGTTTVSESSPLVLNKITSVATTRDLDAADSSISATRSRAYSSLQRAITEGWIKQLELSTQVLAPLWDTADVVIEPGGSLQRTLRWCIYHLIRCTPAMGGQAQICPKGYAGEAYYGRFFWDSEIYFLPFYLHTNPAAARDLLLYRYQTLPGARKNAQHYGVTGAKYPWQSGIDGTEQCSLWEYADNELHISADIAYAVVNYVNASGDLAFMDHYGLEMLLETARYWINRVDSDPEGIPHLLNVMGPDEYSPMARDNAFTNTMVRFNCSEALMRLSDYRLRDHDGAAKLQERLQITTDELDRMKDVAEKLPVPYDHGQKLVLQSSDFPLYADIDIEALWSDKNKAFGFSVTQEKIYRSKCIKQADVIALMTPFPQEFSDEEVQVAYDYYTPYVVHDSSLSPAGHSIIANRLERDDQVEQFLNLALAVDFDQASAKAGDGIHIANCAMIWQLFVYGIAGLSNAVSDTELTLRPRLLPWIDSLNVPIAWNGDDYRITLSSADNHQVLHPAKESA